MASVQLPQPTRSQAGKPQELEFRPHGPLARYVFYGLRMRRECRERFPRYRLQRKPLVSDPGMHHDTCVTHVPWCMSGTLTRGGGENVPGIPGACATSNFTYLARGLSTHGELIGQSLYCPCPGHSQQGVLSAHCSRQPLMAPLITCS